MSVDNPQPVYGQGSRHGKPHRHPDFLIGGAQKCGTTALHVLLNSHPAVFFPRRPQELDFFALDRLYSRGFTWYLRHFAGAGEHHIAVGQTSTAYLYRPRACTRIQRALPTVKLIFILRHPADRAYSHYWHNVRYGLETERFNVALEKERDRVAQGELATLRFSYVDRGLYAKQIARYLELVPPERVLVVLTEQLARESEAVIDRCCRFLGVTEYGRSLPEATLKRRWNAARLPRSYSLQRWTARFRFKSRIGRQLALAIERFNLRKAPYPPMSAEIRTQLAARFSTDISHLAEITGVGLEEWET